MGAGGCGSEGFYSRHIDMGLRRDQLRGRLDRLYLQNTYMLRLGKILLHWERGVLKNCVVG